MWMHQHKCSICGQCHEKANLVTITGPPKFGKYTHYILCTNAPKSGLLRVYIRKLDNGKWTDK